MKVESLCAGLPRDIDWHGRTVLTSIYKTPVDSRLRVTTLNFEGDEQSDLTVYGGVDKAVHVYPSEQQVRSHRGMTWPASSHGVSRSASSIPIVAICSSRRRAKKRIADAAR